MDGGGGGGTEHGGPPAVDVEGFARAAFDSSSIAFSSPAPSHLLYALEPATQRAPTPHTPTRQGPSRERSADGILPARTRPASSSPAHDGRRAPPARPAGKLLTLPPPPPPPAPDRRAPPRGRPVNEELLALLPRMQPAEKLLPCMPSAIATTLIKI
ncbi:hypothetical protein DAI22_05g025900 [Oryza sativa Japonica Group]|nr:hypothetical protein DAI22_05g025900 [Oryza sativa Japonica Group]